MKSTSFSHPHQQDGEHSASENDPANPADGTGDAGMNPGRPRLPYHLCAAAEAVTQGARETGHRSTGRVFFVLVKGFMDEPAFAKGDLV